MALTVNIYYTGKDGNARKFAHEMIASGIVDAIRKEDGNIRYEYLFPVDDEETVLLIDSWKDQQALDFHHKTPMMEQIAKLRDKYDLHMKVERYTSEEERVPILEFDSNRIAKINPETFVLPPLNANKLIITFFPEVIDKLIAKERIILERTIGGENPVLLYRFVNNNNANKDSVSKSSTDEDVLITLGYIGCPACAGNLDLFHAMGINKVMFCGGGGVLDKNIEVGQILVVDGAIRDEGLSYQYIEPSRYVYTNPEVTDKIIHYLNENSISYMRGLTWTTDALFRETNDRIARRKAEGAKIVEMEQAGCIAVSQFRGFAYGALIYGGDDVSQDEWNNRGWQTREGIRYDLVMLCKELLFVI